MPGQDKPQLSITQLIAGAGATVTATVAASYFGVGGTLVGAGAVSVLSTVGATVYQHFLDRGREQLASKIPARVGSGLGGGADADDGAVDVEEIARRPWPKWYVLVGAAVGVFLVVMGLITAFELLTGRPLSNTVRGKTGHGTSVHPIRVIVRPSRSPLTSYETTARPTTAVPASPTPERTARNTPTPTVSGLPLAPDQQRLTPTIATPSPAVTRSPVPQQPADPDEENWHSP
jgi:hypothetical protein